MRERKRVASRVFPGPRGRGAEVPGGREALAFLSRHYDCCLNLDGRNVVTRRSRDNARRGGRRGELLCLPSKAKMRGDRLGFDARRGRFGKKLWQAEKQEIVSRWASPFSGIATE